MLKPDDFCKAHLATLGWRYSQVYGGYVYGQMVMSAIANRVRFGWGSWLEVIENVPLYMAENELPPLKFPSVWEPTFNKLLQCVDAAYDQSLLDITNGATYWCDLNKIERDWFRKRVLDAVQPETGLRVHPVVANQNSIVFLK